MKRPEMTAQRVRDLLDYNPETGIVLWRARIVRSDEKGMRADNGHNTLRAGKRAGTFTGDGHRHIVVDGRSYLEHRLIWLYVHGRWPTPSIDHANCDGCDNRLENLREATRAQNEANKPCGVSNKSGVKGVHWDAVRSKWTAQIKVSGKRKALGRFDDFEAAKEAYRIAAVQHFGSFARLS